jgi:hypothetical protein
VYVVGQAPVVTTSSPLLSREVTALEFREGDTPTKFMVTLPYDAIPGNILRVKLGGREFSIMVPSYLDRGEKIVVIAPAAPYVTPTAIITPPPREIRALEFRDGDVPIKYAYTIPSDAFVGQVIPVSLSGRDFSIKIPDYVRQGESVAIIAPAALI